MSSSIVVPTPSIPIDLAKDLVDFKPPTLSFVLHNARKKPIDLMYMGSLFTVPPVNKIHPEEKRRAYDAEGTPIPGTLVVEDVWGMRFETGEDVRSFDAKKAVKYWLGITASGPTATHAQLTSAHARAGLSILPANAPKELWHAIAMEGGGRTKAYEIERAAEIVDEYDSKNNVRRARGMDAVSPGLDYAKAKLILDAHMEKVTKDLRAEVLPEHEQAFEDEQTEMEIELEMEAMRLAHEKAQATGLDEVELAKRLLSNPAIRKKLEKEYKIRKKGYIEGGDLTDEARAQAKNAAKVVAANTAIVHEEDEPDTDTDTDVDEEPEQRVVERDTSKPAPPPKKMGVGDSKPLKDQGFDRAKKTRKL